LPPLTALIIFVRLGLGASNIATSDPIPKPAIRNVTAVGKSYCPRLKVISIEKSLLSDTYVTQTQAPRPLASSIFNL
jgi:hypothetical protein